MKKLLIPVLAAVGVLTLAAKAPKDPVLLTVGGHPVTLSEFEYFYHKNDGNEIEHETPAQYLERFIDYRLKVARAQDERQDTTAEFRKDFKQYRREIARPYLSDTTIINQLLETSVAHTQEDVKIDVIVLKADDRALADSIYGAVNSGAADFNDMARRHSIDPSARRTGGDFGWLGANQAPYEIEEAVYETPVGHTSKAVETGGYLYLIHPTDRRENVGEVHGAHILVQFKEGLDTAAAHARIDSIYDILQANKSSFENLAKKHSDCPSAAKGGDLDWFGRGQMVPEFENVIFALGNHEYSKPFKTNFGWHIAKKIESRKPSKQRVEEITREMMKRDVRGLRPRLARAEQLKKEYNTRVDEAGREKLMSTVRTLGYDSAKVVLTADPTPLFFVADSTITIGNFLDANYRMNPRQSAETQLAKNLDDRLISATLVYEDHRLEQKYPEFRRQSNEYRDGLMLIASMEKNVWNKPAEDPAGLEAYFNANRDNYGYESPRWKGYILYSTSDSIIGRVDEYLKTVNPAPEVLGDSIKANFPKNVRIERVVLPKGENEIVDFIAFGGPEPSMANTRWKHYVTYLGHTINGPEEVADVRGRVTGDWTRELEKQYVDELRKQYEVKVNKKVLKKAK